MSSRPPAVIARSFSAVRLPLAAIGTVLLFLFAVQLLGTATDAAAPILRQLLLRVVVDDVSALGLGWIGAYVLANGSVVAALALSLFTATLLSVPQLFLMVVGSRLGAAAIVVFIGAVDYLQQRRYSFVDSVSMGLLTFLLTFSIYLPVAALGYGALRRFHDRLLAVSQRWAIDVRPFGLFDPITNTITGAVGPGPSFLLAVAVLFGSLRLFDRVLGEVDTDTLRRRFFQRFERTWLPFGLGLLVTGVTTSVAFSLGIIVPLYNRHYVKRDELIPYILGANIGTLFDTLVVAIILDTPVGTAVVVLILGTALGVTLLALLVHGQYCRLIAAMDDRVLEDRTVFVVFLAILALLPVAFLLLPHLFR